MKIVRELASDLQEGSTNREALWEALRTLADLLMQEGKRGHSILAFEKKVMLTRGNFILRQDGSEFQKYFARDRKQNQQPQSIGNRSGGDEGHAAHRHHRAF